MRTLERNKTDFHYALYEGRDFPIDTEGNVSGTPINKYSEPIAARGNISSASGDIHTEQFGSSLEYDKVIVIDDVNTLIDENTVLFVDKLPEKDKNGNLLYDYIVKGIGKSLNSVSIAIKKVVVS